jgi:hypothetical protein
MNVYATVDEVKRYIGRSVGEETKDDDLLLRFTIKASRMFDNFATNGVLPMRRFYPTLATKNFDHPDDATMLNLKDDLLSCDSLTTKNGATSITSADYVLMTSGGRYNQTPFGIIQLHPDGTVTEFEYDGTPYQSNAIIGPWGYHTDWSNAWEDSGDTVQDGGGIDDVVTTITVNNADGDDINGMPFRFKRQQLIKVENEYMWVTYVNVTDDELTVRRAQNGTTAASHANGVAISIYKPMADVIQAMEVLSAHIYRRRESVGTPDDRPIAGAQGQLILPAVLPEDVKKILRPYKKEAL